MPRSPDIPPASIDAQAEFHQQHVIHTIQVIIGSCLAIAAIVYLLHPLRLLHTHQSGQWLTHAAAQERQSFTGAQPVLRVHHYWFENAGDPELPQVGWIPVALLDQNGRITTRRLDVPADVDCVSHEIWFDPATCRFRRAYIAAEITLFAISFDGEFLYTYDPARGGAIEKQRIDEAFKFPEHPSDLLGLMAGLPVSLNALPEGEHPEYRGEAALANDGIGQLFRFAANAAGMDKGYTWQVSLEKSTGTLAEVTCLEEGKRLLTICRGRTDKTRRPPTHWDLSDITPAQPAPPASLDE